MDQRQRTSGTQDSLLAATHFGGLSLGTIIMANCLWTSTSGENNAAHPYLLLRDGVSVLNVQSRPYQGCCSAVWVFTRYFRLAFKKRVGQNEDEQQALRNE